ncbi:Rha family transcriptional regulator [Paraburkholderia caffeinilytica]|uniref:Rha family transcriptional regulator n=1 Tax=Paraburkholderia caffeinilytica TaxID=1761016 RepID=UPI003DA0024D
MIEIPGPLADFVSIADNRLVTDTLRVARHFHKRHADVLRTYDNRECSAEFSQRNFAPTEYIDIQGKLRRMVQMTKDGFMFLVLGFTGSEAARIKEAFIAAFNEMAAFVRTEQRGLLHDLFALHERERASKERASTGSHLMLERKATKPAMEAERYRLMAMIQPSLFD